MRKLQKALAYLLVFGMMVSLLPVQARAEDESNTTTVYFLNSDNWETVGVHAWRGTENLTGDWGTATATPDQDLGGNWVKATIPAAPTFSIIIFNKDSDGERATLDIKDNESIYVISTGETFTSAKAAEEAAANNTGGGNNPGGSDDSDVTCVYFLNSESWETVGAHAWNASGDLTGGWGTTTATAAEELGSDWVKATVPAAPPFSIIIFNKDKDSERATLDITDMEHVYVTVTGQSYTSKEAAEEAINAAPTTICFLNWDGEKSVLDDVYVYAYANDQPVGPGWPGTPVEEASDLGENWWRVELSANASLSPFTVIFNDNNGNQLNGIAISSYADNYVTANVDTIYANSG